MIVTGKVNLFRKGGEHGYTPRKLGHVNIFVRNAERARDWYEDLLGLHTYGFTPGAPLL